MKKENPMKSILLQARQLQNLLTGIFLAIDTPPDIAECVAESLVDSNLKGVDSHGVMRVTKYVNEVESGWIRPTARPEIKKETSSMAVVKGNLGFGILVMKYAMDLAIQKAKAGQVAAVGVIDNTHIGRVGYFSEMAVEQNVASIIVGGATHGRPGARVAPYGGKKPILATNTWTMGLPGGKYGSILTDISTSVCAEGKLQTYRAKHKELPPNWILDKDGKPSTDVEDFYDGGMLLPAGGHKGYGMAVIAEVLAYALLGPSHETNWLITAIDIAAFRPVAEFAQASESFLQKLKDIPPADGFDEVLFPGEPEIRTAKQRAVDGISIPDETWQEMQETARRVGVDPDKALKGDA